MACRLPTPWWLDRCADVGQAPAVGSTAATRVLDWESAAVQALMAELDVPGWDQDGRTMLQLAHGVIAARVRPVYAVNEAQPVSKTLALGRGSCSQRLAVLEAVARAAGIATRVRGL